MKLLGNKIFIFILLVSGLSNIGFSQTVVNLSVDQPEQIKVFAGEDTTICIGKTITLNSTVSGGEPPYLYLWEPKIGLDDPTSLQPNLTPTRSANYYLTVIDSKNCTATNRVSVNIDPCTGINEINQLNSFDLFPNPNKGVFVIKAAKFKSGEKIDIRVVNIYGKLVYKNIYYSDELLSSFEINIGDQERGTYIIQIRDSEKILNKKFNIM